MLETAFDRARRRCDLATERLRLRPPEPRDQRDWVAERAASRAHLEPWEPVWAADALSATGWRRALAGWRDGWRNGRGFAFFIRRADNDDLIGAANLSNVRYGNTQAASLGYWLGAAHLGQGYMAEAVGRLCEWAFEDLSLERLEAAALPENVASRAVLAANGFAEEGLALEYLQIAGVRRDHVLYGLPRSVWRGRRRP